MRECIGKRLREEYEREVGKRLNEARMTVGEGANINDVFSVFKDVVLLSQMFKLK